MISVSNLSVVFGDRFLFNEVSFFVGQKDKIGLVGKNGAGKSTLLKILKGLQNPSSGQVSFPKDCRIGYLPQEMKHNEEATILDEASLAFEDLKILQGKVDQITLELAQREDYETEEYHRLIERLNDYNDRLAILDGGNLSEGIEKILKGLGFLQEDMSRKLSEFSGGWKMRVELAKILLQTPDVVLLDEPTNHLDLESITWLEKFLQDYSGSIILISHDRDFLDNITNRTIEITKGKVYDYKFPYSKYLVQRRDELEKQKQAYRNQQKYIEDTEKLINKFRAKKNKAAFAQSLIKKLGKLERIEVDEFEKAEMKIVFPQPPHSGKVVLEAHDLEKYFGDKHIFSNVNFYIRKQEKVALVGKNGVGKTTLLKIIAQNEDHQGNYKIGHNVSIGYFAQNEAEKLDVKKTVFETIDEVAVGDIRTKVRSLLGSFLFSGDDVDKKVSVLSGGEKTRLALCKLLLQPHNLLILDEPTNHLDLPSKEVLKNAIKEFQGTVIIVSHDRNFLHDLTEVVYELKKTGIGHFMGDIYQFLREKNAQSIAEYEGRNSENKKSRKADSANKLTYEERKAFQKKYRQLKNRIGKYESEISRLEDLILKKEKEIAEIDFTDKESSNMALTEYQSLKEKLDRLMQDWENAEDEFSKMEDINPS